MYDYNFSERLTQERLTLLLLSLVIPTDTVVLKNIYNKKKELETEDDHKDHKSFQLYCPGAMKSLPHLSVEASMDMYHIHCALCRKILRIGRIARVATDQKYHPHCRQSARAWLLLRDFN
jgi:hypothetical protein